MTDNEIIKALKNEMHLAEYVDSDYCSNTEVSLLKSTLDLINHLQNEKENIEIELHKEKAKALEYQQACEHQQSLNLNKAFECKEYLREIYNLKSRIYGLQAENESLQIQLHNAKLHQKETHKALQDEKVLRLNEDFIKAEAYKEFAERFLSCYEDFDETNEVITYPNLVTAVNDTLKEMECGNNGK